MKTTITVAGTILAMTVQFSQQTLAAKPVKPPPGPVTAGGVVCAECIDTADIVNGAVTTEKLSVDIQDRLDTQDAVISDNVTRIDNNVVSIGSQATKETPPLADNRIGSFFLRR